MRGNAGVRAAARLALLASALPGVAGLLAEQESALRALLGVALNEPDDDVDLKGAAHNGTFIVEDGAVVSVSLDGQHFKGSLSGSFAFPDLESLYVKGTRLQGPLPRLNCSSLTRLEVVGNSELESDIPGQWAQGLPMLEYLELEGSLWTGVLPSEWGGGGAEPVFTELTHLTIRGKREELTEAEFGRVLRGGIPDTWFQGGAFERLLSLDLSFNALNGSVNPSLFERPVLRENPWPRLGSLDIFTQRGGRLCAHLSSVGQNRTHLHGSLRLDGKPLDHLLDALSAARAPPELVRPQQQLLQQYLAGERAFKGRLKVSPLAEIPADSDDFLPVFAFEWGGYEEVRLGLCDLPEMVAFASALDADVTTAAAPNGTSDYCSWRWASCAPLTASVESIAVGGQSEQGLGVFSSPLMPPQGPGFNLSALEAQVNGSMRLELEGEEWRSLPELTRQWVLPQLQTLVVGAGVSGRLPSSWAAAGRFDALQVLVLYGHNVLHGLPSAWLSGGFSPRVIAIASDIPMGCVPAVGSAAELDWLLLARGEGWGAVAPEESRPRWCTALPELLQRVPYVALPATSAVVQLSCGSCDDDGVALCTPAGLQFVSTSEAQLCSPGGSGETFIASGNSSGSSYVCAGGPEPTGVCAKPQEWGLSSEQTVPLALLGAERTSAVVPSGAVAIAVSNGILAGVAAREDGSDGDECLVGRPVVSGVWRFHDEDACTDAAAAVQTAKRSAAAEVARATGSASERAAAAVLDLPAAATEVVCGEEWGLSGAHAAVLLPPAAPAVHFLVGVRGRCPDGAVIGSGGGAGRKLRKLLGGQDSLEARLREKPAREVMATTLRLLCPEEAAMVPAWCSGVGNPVRFVDMLTAFVHFDSVEYNTEVLTPLLYASLIALGIIIGFTAYLIRVRRRRTQSQRANSQLFKNGTSKHSNGPVIDDTASRDQPDGDQDPILHRSRGIRAGSALYHPSSGRFPPLASLVDRMFARFKVRVTDKALNAPVGAPLRLTQTRKYLTDMIEDLVAHDKLPAHEVSAVAAVTAANAMLPSHCHVPLDLHKADSGEAARILHACSSNARHRWTPGGRPATPSSSAHAVFLPRASKASPPPCATLLKSAPLNPWRDVLGQYVKFMQGAREPLAALAAEAAPWGLSAMQQLASTRSPLFEEDPFGLYWTAPLQTSLWQAFIRREGRGVASPGSHSASDSLTSDSGASLLHDQLGATAQLHEDRRRLLYYLRSSCIQHDREARRGAATGSLSNEGARFDSVATPGDDEYAQGYPPEGRSSAMSLEANRLSSLTFSAFNRTGSGANSHALNSRGIRGPSPALTGSIGLPSRAGTDAGGAPSGGLPTSASGRGSVDDVSARPSMQQEDAVGSDAAETLKQRQQFYNSILSPAGRGSTSGSRSLSVKANSASASVSVTGGGGGGGSAAVSAHVGVPSLVHTPSDTCGGDDGVVVPAVHMPNLSSHSKSPRSAPSPNGLELGMEKSEASVCASDQMCDEPICDEAAAPGCACLTRSFSWPYDHVLGHMDVRRGYLDSDGWLPRTEKVGGGVDLLLSTGEHHRQTLMQSVVLMHQRVARHSHAGDAGGQGSAAPRPEDPPFRPPAQVQVVVTKDLPRVMEGAESGEGPGEDEEESSPTGASSGPEALEDMWGSEGREDVESVADSIEGSLGAGVEATVKLGRSPMRRSGHARGSGGARGSGNFAFVPPEGLRSGPSTPRSDVSGLARSRARDWGHGRSSGAGRDTSPSPCSRDGLTNTTRTPDTADGATVEMTSTQLTSMDLSTEESRPSFLRRVSQVLRSTVSAAPIRHGGTSTPNLFRMASASAARPIPEITPSVAVPAAAPGAASGGANAGYMSVGKVVTDSIGADVEGLVSTGGPATNPSAGGGGPAPSIPPNEMTPPTQIAGTEDGGDALVQALLDRLMPLVKDNEKDRAKEVLNDLRSVVSDSHNMPGMDAKTVQTDIGPFMDLLADSDVDGGTMELPADELNPNDVPDHIPGKDEAEDYGLGPLRITMSQTPRTAMETASPKAALSASTAAIAAAAAAARGEPPPASGTAGQKPPRQRSIRSDLVRNVTKNGRLTEDKARKMSLANLAVMATMRMVDRDLDIEENSLVYKHKLGHGAFGEVWFGTWRAKDGVLHNVAIKVLIATQYGAIRGKDKMRKKFHDEMVIMSAVRHKNIVRCFGGRMAKRDGERDYMVLEYMNGGSLDNYIHKVRNKMRLTVKEVLSIGMHVAEALKYMHPVLVHRDLKPCNIMTDKHGVMKITDFGISKLKHSDNLTGAMIGTPAYTAPEVYRQDKVNEKCDIFALGIIMWECIVHQRPFAGMHWYQVMHQMTRDRAEDDDWLPFPAACPIELKKLIRRCWHASKSSRYDAHEVVSTANELIRTLPSETLSNAVTLMSTEVAQLRRNLSYSRSRSIMDSRVVTTETEERSRPLAGIAALAPVGGNVYVPDALPDDGAAGAGGTDGIAPLRTGRGAQHGVPPLFDVGGGGGGAMGPSQARRMPLNRMGTQNRSKSTTSEASWAEALEVPPIRSPGWNSALGGPPGGRVGGGSGLALNFSYDPVSDLAPSAARPQGGLPLGRPFARTRTHTRTDSSTTSEASWGVGWEVPDCKPQGEWLMRLPGMPTMPRVDERAAEGSLGRQTSQATSAGAPTTMNTDHEHEPGTPCTPHTPHTPTVGSSVVSGVAGLSEGAGGSLGTAVSGGGSMGVPVGYGGAHGSATVAVGGSEVDAAEATVFSATGAAQASPKWPAPAADPAPPGDKEAAAAAAVASGLHPLHRAPVAVGEGMAGVPPAALPEPSLMSPSVADRRLSVPASVPGVVQSSGSVNIELSSMMSLQQPVPPVPPCEASMTG